jgi:hypothetical protein
MKIKSSVEKNSVTLNPFAGTELMQCNAFGSRQPSQAAHKKSSKKLVNLEE